MARAHFARPAHIVGGAATITQSGGTVDTLYPLANLVDRNPAKPTKWTTATAVDVLFDWGAAQRVDGAYLPIYTTVAGGTITVAMNATNSWGSPTVTLSKVVPAFDRDGLPIGLFFDLRPVAGYTTSGLRYLRLSLPSGAVNLAIGEVAIASELVSFTRNIQWGVRRGDVRRQVMAETEFGVRHVYDRGVRQAVFQASMQTTDAGMAQLRELHADTRGGRDQWLFVLDPDVAHTAYSVRFDGASAALLDRTEDFLNVQHLAFGLIEVQRGLPL